MILKFHCSNIQALSNKIDQTLIVGLESDWLASANDIQEKLLKSFVRLVYFLSCHYVEQICYPINFSGLSKCQVFSICGSLSLH